MKKIRLAFAVTATLGAGTIEMSTAQAAPATPSIDMSSGQALMMVNAPKTTKPQKKYQEKEIVISVGNHMFAVPGTHEDARNQFSRISLGRPIYPYAPHGP